MGFEDDNGVHQSFNLVHLFSPPITEIDRDKQVFIIISHGRDYCMATIEKIIAKKIKKCRFMVIYLRKRDCASAFGESLDKVWGLSYRDI